jgi:hypothetical protein
MRIQTFVRLHNRALSDLSIITTLCKTVFADTLILSYKTPERNNSAVNIQSQSGDAWIAFCKKYRIII